MNRILPRRLFFSSLDFSEISEGSRVKCFRKFPKGEGLNSLRKFTGQGTCSHIHSKVFLGNMRCFWDSVGWQPVWIFNYSTYVLVCQHWWIYPLSLECEKCYSSRHPVTPRVSSTRNQTQVQNRFWLVRELNTHKHNSESCSWKLEAGLWKYQLPTSENDDWYERHRTINNSRIFFFKLEV